MRTPSTKLLGYVTLDAKRFEQRRWVIYQKWGSCTCARSQRWYFRWGVWKKEQTTISVITGRAEDSGAGCIPLFLLLKLVHFQIFSDRK